MKPFQRGFRRVKKDYNLKKEEMCIIGDQIMTDILGGNKYGIYILRSFDAEVLPRDTFFMDGTVIKKWYKPKYLKDVPVATPTVKYYAKYTGKSGSLVEALNAIGADSSFNNRKAIAKANNINGYIGSSSQNIKMLNLLKQGRLIKRP